MPIERRLLIFQLGDHSLAVSAIEVQEIVLMPALLHSPGQPAVLSGFLNLRGTAAPVIQLHRLFDIPAPEPDLHTPLVIVRSVARTMALQVDRVDDVIRVEESALIPLSQEASFNGCAEAEFSWQGRTTVLLSVERLLLQEESRRLTEMQSRVQGYLDDLTAGGA